MSSDPRVYVAARTLAREMGVDAEWKLYMGEARAVIRAVDQMDTEEAA